MPKKINKLKAAKQATQIRINEKYFDAVKQIAEVEKRTFNSQVEYFLEKAIDDYIEKNPDSQEELYKILYSLSPDI